MVTCPQPEVQGAVCLSRTCPTQQRSPQDSRASRTTMSAPPRLVTDLGTQSSVIRRTTQGHRRIFAPQKTWTWFREK